MGLAVGWLLFAVGDGDAEGDAVTVTCGFNCSPPHAASANALINKAPVVLTVRRFLQGRSIGPTVPSASGLRKPFRPVGFLAIRARGYANVQCLIKYVLSHQGSQGSEEEQGHFG